MTARPSVAVVLAESITASAHDNGADAWWRYATEIFGHLRVPLHVMTDLETADIPEDIRVLVVARVPAEGQSVRERLQAWVDSGGALITVGDPAGLAGLVGASAGTVVEAGHVRIGEADVWTSLPDVPLRAIGGVRLAAMPDSRTLASWDDDGAPAITMRRIGRGVAIAIGADVWQSVVRIQQGYPVARDGIPATDGSAPIDDDILKCEDGLALDIERDRALPDGQQDRPDGYEHVYPPASGLPMFHRPHADMWRSVLLQCVWWAAEQADAAVPWLHYWPAGVSAVAHMSHDADQNVDEHGRAALDSFAEADVRVTWCQLFPGGYLADTYAAITAAGHEQALHYNAMHDADIAEWGWPQMRAQYAWAQAVTGAERIVSNKNHYTRWEGYTEFYEWCERLGIEIDQSRGPSKQGTVGFPFGTAHLSFPMSGAEDGNRYHDVLNLPLHTQDLAWASHESVRDVILDAVESQHGVAHFLFHGAHLHRRPETRKACVALAHEARRRGMPWWTSAELNRWERARRQVTLSLRDDADGWLLEAVAGEPVHGAAILLLLPGREGLPTVREGSGTLSTVRRHGREFVELSADIPVGSSIWSLAHT
ncbi:hypothetical protein G1H11_10320 [Phytoactinopolyspora alkaliphila]|uniref:Uncharacterized protein n=1 Tax=Phytoactinopolyspora alkaliphila TaxID=1783498 RepID=A0A6N9YKY8_9ACTN|nr:hypothetical protein [Phytoactinopolyspora alkaliphila]NED95706.1 hypothetical protein [Phytoactinopolyspora alkaliphila]